MKIIQVNQFHYPRGGADKYFLALTETLKNSGHEVAVFSMEHPKNLPSPWEKYFVSRISFNEGGLADRLKTPGRVLYSREAKKKFAALIGDFRPDLIHIHNIYHHLSPSILDAATKAGVPVVMHLHDYKMICPNHALFNRGQYCERCYRQKYYHCLTDRCVKDSLAGSALAALEMYVHHPLLHIYEKSIDRFIAPSNFMKDILVRFGQDGNKIKTIYNCYNPELLEEASVNDTGTGGYLFSFGRLSKEKGLDTLVRAAALTGRKTIIAGDGPEAENLKKYAVAIGAPVEFQGFKDPCELRQLIRRAEAVVIPSIWAENMPLTLLEALSLGRIVIASRIGGIPEIITDNVNGLLFTPGDAPDLARQIDCLPSLDREEIGRQAARTGERFSPENNLREVVEAYSELIK